MATLANGSSTCSGGGTIRVYRPQTATPMPRAHRTPTAGAGAGAGACASITATAARPQKRARTSSNSTPASRVATGVAATASVTTARHDTAEEVAGQLLIDKTAAEALAATGFTPRDAEPSHVYEAGHAAFLAVQEAVEAVHARESLPASVEMAVPRLLLMKTNTSRTGADWWPHTRLYAKCRYDVDPKTGEVWLVRVLSSLEHASPVAEMAYLLSSYGRPNMCYPAHDYGLYDANGAHIKNIMPDAGLFLHRQAAPAGTVMGANQTNALVIFEFECHNRSTPVALAHGAQIMCDPRVQVLIYGKGYPRAHGPPALMFVVYQRRPGVAGAPPVLVATAAYDVGGVAMSARSKRQWEGGFPRGRAATDPFLPRFGAGLWQRLVPRPPPPGPVGGLVAPVAAPIGQPPAGPAAPLVPVSMDVCGWNTAGGAIVVPATGVAVAAALIQRPGCDARVAAHAAVGIAHISSATLQTGVNMAFRGSLFTNDLYLDLL